MNTEDKLKFNINKLNKLFNNLSYYSKYSNDIWLTIIIFIVFIYVIMYYTTLNYIKSYKNNWDKIKCNPFVMPFVGIIRSDLASKDSNFVEDNFKSCMNNLNKEITDKSKQSINGIFNTFNDSLKESSSISSSIMDNITHLFNQIVNMFTEFTNRLVNLNTAFSDIFITVNNFIGHILGVIAIIYYEVILLVNGLKLIVLLIALAFLGAIVVPSILALVICIIIYFICLVLAALSWLFCVGCPFIPLSAIALLACLILLIWVILIVIIYTTLANGAKYILSETLGPVSDTPPIEGPPAPGIPSF